MNGQLGYKRTRSNASNISVRSDDSEIAEYTNEQSHCGNRKKLRKPLYIWSTEDVMRWLRIHHSQYYELYYSIFEHHELTGRALIRLNSAKLEKIGITNSDHREDLLVQILRLQIKHQMKLLQKLQQQEPAHNAFNGD